MTRLEVQIGDLVVRGLPTSYGPGLGALVEGRIGALARGEILPERDDEVSDESSLADLVAMRVWDEVRRSGRVGGDGV